MGAYYTAEQRAAYSAAMLDLIEREGPLTRTEIVWRAQRELGIPQGLGTRLVGELIVGRRLVGAVVRRRRTWGADGRLGAELEATEYRVRPEAEAEAPRRRKA